MWPATAAIPSRILEAEPQEPRTATGTHPLATSTIRTRRPGSFPTTRATLVAPIFPLPLRLTSIPLSRPTNTPVGMLPNR